MVRHQSVAGNLAADLWTHAKEHKLGHVLIGPIDMLLSPRDILMPDLEFTSTERQSIVKEEYLQGPPDLVIEILNWSTRRRDLGPKRAHYDHLGVGDYWAVAPDRDDILVYRRAGAGFLPPLRLTAEAGDRLTPPLLPCLEISLREVFERAEPYSALHQRLPGFRAKWA